MDPKALERIEKLNYVFGAAMILLALVLTAQPVALGVTIGVVLELYLLVSFPTGGARFPEGATATVVAVACAAPFPGAGAVPLAIAVGLVIGEIFFAVMVTAVFAGIFALSYHQLPGATAWASGCCWGAITSRRQTRRTSAPRSWAAAVTTVCTAGAEPLSMTARGRT